MLDIKYIRQNPEVIKDACKKKKIEFDLDAFLKIDKERIELIKETEEIRRIKNEANEKIKKAKDKEEREGLIAEMKNVDGGDKEERLKELDKKFKELILLIPNIPDESVPVGDSDADNVEIRKWGKIPKLNFDIKDHVQIAQDLDLIDFERGAKTVGFRGYFLKDKGFQLCFALWSYAMDLLIKKGFIPMHTPSLVKESALIGTGWLPQQADEVYKTTDGMYLVGTSEAPLMDYHSGEILNESDLPKKYLGFSPCFRTEIGSYGKDTKGILRVHEFFKLEQVVLCKNDKAESIKFHEEITKNAEEILKGLEIPYRVVVNCSGDLGLGQVKKYDIEAWSPSQEKYRETHSSSYFYDFQTRRLNIKYRDKEGELKYAHSLNNTGIATPRILLPLLENYQQKDGSVKVPKVLHKYLNFKVIKNG